MGLYDTFRNRKPKAGTVFLICSKWFEDGTQMLFGDTASVVLNLDDDGSLDCSAVMEMVPSGEAASAAISQKI